MSLRKNLEQVDDSGYGDYKYGGYWVLINTKTNDIISYRKKKYKNVKVAKRGDYFLGGYR